MNKQIYLHLNLFLIKNCVLYQEQTTQLKTEYKEGEILITKELINKIVVRLCQKNKNKKNYELYPYIIWLKKS